MSIFGDYPTFSACLISPCLCYFTIAVNPSANASVGSPGMGLLWLFQLCSPEELCRCCVGMMAQGRRQKHPGVSGDGCALPTQPGLSWASPCQRFLLCLTKSRSRQLLEAEGGGTALPVPVPSFHPVPEAPCSSPWPGERVSVQLLGKTISSYSALWEGWHEDVLGSMDLRHTPHTQAALWVVWKLLK